MPAFISSIGTAVAEFTTNQADIADYMVDRLELDGERARELKVLYRASGIRQRHSVLNDFQPNGQSDFFSNGVGKLEPTVGSRMQVYRNEALALASEAVEAAMAEVSLTTKDITHLITVSCTGMYAPGLDIELVETMDFMTDVERTNINFMGCYAAFNALKSARYIVEAQPTARVLVVCVELCTIHYQDKKDPDTLLANALFGDGAAAVVLTSGGFAKVELEIMQHYADLSLPSKTEMTWTIGDHGFDMKLSGLVPDVIKQGIKQLTHNLLEHLPIDHSEVDYYAIHPGGKKIIEVIEQELELSPEDNHPAREILRSHGNMSSPTILFVINQILEDLTSQDANKKILCFAFGPGLTMESILLNIRSDV